MTTVKTSQPTPGVTQVTLNRPDRLNTLDDQLVSELTRVLDGVAEDSECRVVVLTGEGRAFCAGLDLNGYGDEAKVKAQGEAARHLSRQKEIARLAQRLHSLPQPVIAAVNGPAAGGGLALVCACDIRISVDSAVFAVSFVRAGFSACDMGISWLLPRIMGAGRAHELMLTGRRFDAAEALRLGLLTDVVDADSLLRTALDKAAEIMLNPPLSVELTKEGMWAALEISAFDTAVEFENRQQIVTSFTADRLEATAAFMEKRAPVYRRR